MHRATRRGALQPGELAEAVVLGDVSLALTVVAQFVPVSGAVLIAAAVVPLAVVAARHRLRAVIAGTIAASVVGFLVVGLAAPLDMAACGALGALVGAADRRGWSPRRTLATGVAMFWPASAAITVGLLFVFSNLRRLALDNVRNGWTGLFNFAHGVDQVIAYVVTTPMLFVPLVIVIGVRVTKRVRAAGADGRETAMRLGIAAVAFGIVIAGFELLGWLRPHANAVIDWTVEHWWLTIPIALLLGLWFFIWLAIGLSTPTLGRVRAAFGAAHAEEPLPEEGSSPTIPVPVQLHDVHFRYPNADHDALEGITLDVAVPELLAIVGANGSGKSTLARVIAGRRSASSGTISRPGAVGLGRPRGTAIVSQRPEAQVLGVQVRDDVIWGLPDAHAVDIDAVLDRVGLLPLADRETSTLSGGELQRLAVAAAIAREPRLLVSDESTAMVDAEGRARLMSVLRDLVETDGLSVVHVTHHPAEAASADRVVTLAHGTIADAPRPSRVTGLHVPRPRRPHRPGRAEIELRGVGHVYSRGTPWANRALTDVNLTLRRGESLLVVGHNGSGKSTLAWILAGLIAPSEGTAELGGAPITNQIGRVGLSFQHARLQLLRPTVLDDIKTAAGVDDRTAFDALAAVGLAQVGMAGRRVDELSGGQLRRVVLAGVLASQPVAVVLDEPFAGLDAEGRDELDRLLSRLRNEHDIALVIVSHDHDLPEGVVDRVVELDAGRIVRDEPLDDISAEGGRP